MAPDPNQINFFATITYPINFAQTGFNAPFQPLPPYEFGIEGKAAYDYSEFFQTKFDSSFID
jgi:hypothetical protein